MGLPIVVGVDWTEGSIAALRWAVGASEVLGSDVVLATVGDAGAAPRPAREAWQAQGRPDRTVTLEGDARVALLEVATKEDAALLVVGSGRSGWFPALHLGSVSHHVAHHADRPVCVVPPGQTGFDARRVVVGLDGSPGSAAAATWAGALATATGGTVVAAHAWQRSAHPIGQPRTREHAERDLELWTQPLVGIGLERVVDEGEPSAVLASVADRTAAGVVVLGTRGAGGFHDLRLGSVPLRLLQHAHTPTVLVPPP